jgi:2-keto-3-deoxy-galactonokinase
VSSAKGPEHGSSLFVGIDTGTTNTRAWLVDGDRILARREAAAGARDTARDGHDRKLRAADASVAGDEAGGVIAGLQHDLLVGRRRL